MDMRYVGQWRSLTVPVSTPLEENLDASLERFHNEHEREYAFSDRDQAVEIYGLRVVGLGLVDKPEFPKLERGGGRSGAKIRERPVYFGEASGFLNTAIYDRSALPAGISLRRTGNRRADGFDRRRPARLAGGSRRLWQHRLAAEGVKEIRLAGPHHLRSM